MILVLALMLSVGAWAQDHQRYTSAVNLSVLEAGDTLAEGASITDDIGDPSWDRFMKVTQDRAKKNGALVTGAWGESIDIASTIGAGGVIINGSVSFTPVTESGDDGDAWVVTSLEVEEGDALISIAISGVLLPVPAPTVEVTRNSDTNWTFTMPGYNTLLKVTYFEQPGLTWFLGTGPMPADGLTITRGFHADAIQNIMLHTSDTFSRALQSPTSTLLTVQSTWNDNMEPFTVSYMPGFVDNESLTNAQALAIPNPNPSADAALIYKFSEGIAMAVLYVNGDIAQYVSLSDVYNAAQYGGLQVYYTTSVVPTPVALHYGSSNPAVVSFSNPNDMSSVSINGAGEADIYAVFDGDATFQYDSVAFHLTVTNPPILTLASNDTAMGTVELQPVDVIPLGKEITVVWNDGMGNSMENPLFTKDGVSVTTQGMRLDRAFYSGSSSIFTTNLGHFRRIEINGSYVSAAGGAGWTKNGNTTIWTGDNDSVTFAATAYETTITFTLDVDILIYPDGVAVFDNANVFGVLPGTELTVIATPAENHYVASWSNDAAVDNILGTTQTFTMPDKDTNLTANFASVPTITLISNNAAMGTVEPDALYINGLNTGALFNKMTKVDNNGHNGDYGQWNFYNNFGTQYSSHTSLPGDDWLVTPALTVEAGHTYGVSFYVNSDYLRNRFEVRAAADNTADALSSGLQVVDSTVLQMGESRLAYGTFTPSTDGVYYVGIHSISDYLDRASFMVQSLFIDDITSGVTGTATVGTYRVLPGTVVTVNATPAANYYVASWSNDTAVDNMLGAKQTITMGAENIVLTANFATIPTLTLAANDTTMGSVALQLIGKDSTLYSNALNTQALFNQMTVLDKNGHTKQMVSGVLLAALE